jgi:hypothetical protein
MKRAYSALMAVIIMGAVMMIVALTLVNLGGDASELGVIMSNRYYVRNLARACSEKSLRYLRNQEDLDEVESYQARVMMMPSDDTMIWSGQPGWSYGSAPTLALYSGSALLYRFDVAGNLPASSTIDEAKLRLYSVGDQAQEAAIRAYKILPANGAWLEGNNNGTPTTFFEANWNWLDYGSLTAWAGSAGMGTAGTDYYAIPEAGLSLAAASSTAYELDLNTATVASWLNADDNHGLILRTDSDNWFWFASKESSRPNQRPVLDVVYNTDDWLSLAGGIKQERGYCFYENVNQGGGQWLIKTTAISDDLWSLEEVGLTKSTSSPGMVQINSWREVASHD